jgi:hypothetical protein
VIAGSATEFPIRQSSAIGSDKYHTNPFRSASRVRQLRIKTPPGKIQMNARNFIAAVLITMGIVVLAYSGITFTTPGETIRFLGFKIQTTDSHFIPPVVGVLTLIGGIVLVLVKPTKA